VIKDQIVEICSCRQLSAAQIEQLKHLVNEQDMTSLPVDEIANKNDFHQQTKNLRDLVITQNQSLLSQIELLLKRKRKRTAADDPSSDNDEAAGH
jgi:hypothetical protein